MPTKVLAILVFLISLTGYSTDYYVDASRPNDAGTGKSWSTAKRTIQAAFDVSTDNDVLWVTNGVYTSIVTWNGTRTIRSVSGAAKTIIDGGTSNRCATLGSLATDTNTTLIGFTLCNGYLSNVRQAGAGAIGGTLFYCIISNNTALAGETVTNPGGGGNYWGVLDSCIVTRNSVNGANAAGGATANSILRNCLVTQNYATRSGGGTWSSDLLNSTVIGNTVGTSGLGAGVCYGALVNCIVVSNTMLNGTLANHIYLNDGTIDSFYNCTSPQLTGIGNISSPPEFVDMARCDYRLRTDSPCINTGTNIAIGATDLAGNVRIQNGTIDMGAYEGGFKIAQAITFPALPAKIYGDSPFVATATASSGLPVDLQCTSPAVAIITNGAITILGVGTAAIIATQLGDSVYDAAPPVTNSLSVGLPAVTITPADGTVFTNSLSVALNSAFPDATIRYTFDQTDPTESSVLYTNAILLTLSATLKTRAFAVDATPGPISSASYTGLYTVSVTNGTVDGTSTGVYASGSTLALAANAPPAGFHFTTWLVAPTATDLGSAFSSTQATTTFTAPPVALSLTADFSANAYTVHLDPRGGSVDPTNLTVTFDSPYGPLPTPARTGYAFTGWTAATNGAAFPVDSNTVVAVAADHALSAGWAANAYAVTLDPRGGAVDPTNVTVTFDALYGPLPEPARTGYAFTGWTAATNGVAFQVTSNTVVSVAADHALTAGWTANSYTVFFDARSGSVTPASKAVVFNAPYGALPIPSLATPNRVVYTFGGWFLDTACADGPVTETNVLSTAADHALYAKWTPDPYLCDPSADIPLTTSGRYTGYFYTESPFAETASSEVRGTLQLSLNSTNGKCTAKALLQRGQVTFNSTVWAAQSDDATKLASLTARSGETLALSMRQNRLWGTLSGGSLSNETFTLEGARNRFADRKDASAQTNLAAFKGYYTIALPPAAQAPTGAAQVTPEGCGHLTLTVGSAGEVKIAGRLADGASLSFASTLLLFDGCGPEACVPFFAPMYNRNGWVSGLLWFTPDGRAVVVTDRDLGWFMRWEKPASLPDGVSALLDAAGGYYSTVTALASHYSFSAQTNAVDYHYIGGTAAVQTVAMPLDIHVTRSGTRLVMARGTAPKLTGGAYDYSSTNSAMTKLSFTPRTGIFSGAFNLYYDYTANGRLQHKTVPIQYAGILTPVRGDAFADEPAGQGYYLLPDNDPLWRTLPFKRSFLITLDAEP